MIHKKLLHKTLAFCLSLTLLIGSLSPMSALAVQPEAPVISENSVAGTDEMTIAQPGEDQTTQTFYDAEDEESISPETLEGTATFTFYDEDGATPICGPIEKDLSAVTVDADKGRYIFDAINESGASVPDPAALSALPYIRNGRKIDKWRRVSNGKTYGFSTLASGLRFKASESFVAVYTGSPYSYSLEYDLDGGEFEYENETEAAPASFAIDSETIAFPSAYKKGYLFQGWLVTNTSAGALCGQMLPSVPAGTYMDFSYADILNDAFTGYQLKAVYEQIAIGTPSVASAKNTKNGIVDLKIATSADSTSGVSYELCYGTNKNFKKTATHTTDLGTKTSYKLTNMPKGKTYYFKVRGYVRDAKDNIIYSPYSPTVSLKISKGVAEAGKSTKTSAKLAASNVKIDGNKNLYVSATIKKRLKSYDDFYYLVAIDPCNGKILRAVADSDKNKTAIFQTPVRDDKGTNLINGKYAVAIKTGKKKFKQISNAYYISNPEAAADYTGAYPVTKSKKGVQGVPNLELGVKQSFTNFSINGILAADANSGTKYVYNGKTYYFNEPASLANYVSSCNKAGITCSVQLMLNWPGTGKYKALLFGTKTNSAKTNLYAINASTTQSREIVEAAFTFLADRLGKENCHVDNWILGNEVNIYKDWYYAGSTGHEAFMKNYANSFRILYNSVKGRNQNARVFICTDHTWKNRSGDWGAKPFMESFHKEIKSMNKNIQWNLAYHAYPAILYIPATWKDSLAPNNDGADFVTPKNLNILTDYVKKNYGQNTRIIISECGFTSADGEAVQAAALAYSFYKAQFNDMIDAFIIRTVDDSPGERLTKLDGTVIDANFGLRSASGKARAAYNVFKYMDTPDYEKYTGDCLSTIGQGSWSNIIPGFSDSTLKAMPKR